MNTNNTFLCYGCGGNQQSTKFSKSQLKKRFRRRCKVCILEQNKVQNPNHWLMAVHTKQDEYSKQFWTSLDPVPDDHSKYSNCVAFNDEEFIVATSKTQCTILLYVYNTSNNKWKQFMESPIKDIYSCHGTPTISINKNKNILYLYNYTAKLYGTDTYFEALIVVDLSCENNTLNKNKWFSINAPETYLAHDPLLLYTNNALHLHAGDGTLKHYILYDNATEFICIHTLDRLMSDWGRGYVYISFRNEILFFGGGNGDCSHRCFDGIWRYLIVENKWIPIDIQMATRGMVNFGYVMTDDEKYLIIFCGKTKNHGDYTKDIYVLNLYTMQFKKSKILCPFYQPIHCVIVIDKSKTSLITRGYLRKCYKIKNNNLPVLVDDAVMLIEKWYSFEIIHIISHDYGTDYGPQQIHYKINMNDIVCNLY